ncbi:hypothetical protein HCN51_16345 [Nonomuraea sp. FMUSA5-5]|uniref:Lipoprotein n=1 Tax=Nonomuraea composti TaxID=2720023 RepID=A0ABX1B2E4_9ACTN|nr:hypothetical protein [Nonomuraea sp. FMUSA5-5]NJP91007.1 hypothetical protein [Nonomuraea sp. FMUSA5-5]
MKRSRLAVIAVLASLCACGPSGAGPVPTAAGTETIVLRRADQPQARRPTLERLEREAAASGRPLEEVVKRYAARMAATSSPRPTDFEGYDPAATDPDVVIDGIPYAELVGRKGFSAAELRQAQDTVVSWLRSRPEVATMMAHPDEETGQVKVTVQPKVMPDDAGEFTRGLQLPDLGNPRISVEVRLSAEPVAVRKR